MKKKSTSQVVILAAVARSWSIVKDARANQIRGVVVIGCTETPPCTPLQLFLTYLFHFYSAPRRVIRGRSARRDPVVTWHAVSPNRHRKHRYSMPPIDLREVHYSYFLFCCLFFVLFHYFLFPLFSCSDSSILVFIFY